MNQPFQNIQIIGFFVVTVLTIACYSIMPAIGTAVLVVLDRMAFGMRWLAAGSPATAWLLTGALFGGLAGAAMGLRRAGAARRAPKLLLSALGAVAALFILGIVYAGTMRPTQVPAAAPTANHTQVITVYSYTQREP